MASAPRPRRVEGGPGDALALLAVALRPPADLERLAGCLATLQRCLDDPEARQWAERILAKKPTMPRYLQRRERPWFRKANALLKNLRKVS